MIHLSEKYWDCECEKNFIHSKLELQCDECGAKQGEQPDSRKKEVEKFVES